MDFRRVLVVLLLTPLTIPLFLLIAFALFGDTCGVGNINCDAAIMAVAIVAGATFPALAVYFGSRKTPPAPSTAQALMPSPRRAFSGPFWRIFLLLIGAAVFVFLGWAFDGFAVYPAPQPDFLTASLACGR
jgi:hypothetical protein